MTHLALDMASLTGYAVFHDAVPIASGVMDFKKKRGQTNGIMFMRFHKWLFTMLQEHGHFRWVAYEQAHFKGGAATEICVGLQTHLQSFCAAHRIEAVGYHTGTIKKSFTGSGTAGKADMIAAVQIKYDIEPQDDNEADALALGSIAWENLGYWDPTEEAF